jgi:UDPglucose--hexose-1-phosphate uridylyltransferase
VNALSRHELLHEDGRRVYAYGSLREGASLASGAETGSDGIHKRLDLLTGDWIAVSPVRNVRPLDSAGATDDENGCPVCPGGIELPFDYDAAVFENRFPSFVAEPPPVPVDALAAPSRGRCEVVIYTSRHDTSLGRLAPAELGRLLAIWVDRSRELWADLAHQLVLIFENRGAEAGATMAHPHGQIYAFDHLPPLPTAKVRAHRRHRADEGRCLGCDVVARESSSRRIVLANDSFAVGVPFAARWPYEVAVRARRHGLSRLEDLGSAEQVDLLRAIRDVALRYDALFGFECPYLMVVQEAPRSLPDWHLAFEFYPFPRSRTTTKIRASVETATGLFLNDVLPEDAARRLAELAVEAAPIDADCLFVVETAAPRDRTPHELGARS